MTVLVRLVGATAPWRGGGVQAALQKAGRAAIPTEALGVEILCVLLALQKTLHRCDFAEPRISGKGKRPFAMGLNGPIAHLKLKKFRPFPMSFNGIFPN